MGRYVAPVDWRVLRLLGMEREVVLLAPAVLLKHRVSFALISTPALRVSW